MKTLLILMIFLSVCMGIPSNIGWFSLYGTEFTGPISEIRAGSFPMYRLSCWVILLLAHISVISLLLFTKKKYFTALLIGSPLFFILIFTAFDLFALVFLIPFIIVWIIALVVQSKKTTSR
jgi:hypothetical protein